MRANPTQVEPQGAAPVATELAWRCHPVRRQPVRGIVVVTVLVVVFWLLAQYTSSVPFAFLLTLVVFFSLSAYFFPTSYRFSQHGVHVKTLITSFERPWSTYRSYWPDRNGVLLSPFPRGSRLENFRGLFVRFENNKDEVLAYVRQYVAEPEVE